MKDPGIDAPIRLVGPGLDHTVTAHALYDFVLSSLEALVHGDGRYTHPLLSAVLDAERAEAAPETWAAFLWLVGDALHRQ